MRYLFNDLAYALQDFLHEIEDDYLIKKEIELRKAIKSGYQLDPIKEKEEILIRLNRIIESSKKVNKYLKQVLVLERKMSKEFKNI